MRRRRGGRERAPLEDRGALPPRLLRPRFRPRYPARAADGIAPRAFLFARRARAGSPAMQPAARLPYSEFSPDDRERGARRAGLEGRSGRRRRPWIHAAGSSRVSAPPQRRALAAPRFQRAADRICARAGQARRPPATGRPRRISAGSHSAAGDVAVRALRSAPAGPDPRELHHRRRPRRAVDHRSARGARAHSVRAGDEAARRRPGGDRSACSCR